MGIFKKINFGLRKTRKNVSGAIDNVLDSYTSIDQDLFDELEEALVMGDVGVSTAAEITLRLNGSVFPIVIVPEDDGSLIYERNFLFMVLPVRMN